MFESAVEALRRLKYDTFLEIRRYQTPPLGTVILAECLCSMFKVRPVNWEMGHALILREK